jgi:hypothetical protein
MIFGLTEKEYIQSLKRSDCIFGDGEIKAEKYAKDNRIDKNLLNEIKEVLKDKYVCFVPYGDFKIPSGVLTPTAIELLLKKEGFECEVYGVNVKIFKNRSTK